MKKAFVFVLLLALVLMCGCSASAPDAEPGPTPVPTPEPTAAEDMEFTLSEDGTDWTGRYTGALKHMLPDGPGRFEGTGTGQSRYVWDGGWSGGRPSGKGTLIRESLTASVEGETASGLYSGEGTDGIPDGHGSFTSADSEGVPFTYTGSWDSGKIEGTGTLVYDSQNRYVRAGTFTDGQFTPTWTEALEALGTCEPLFTVTEDRLAFIEQYPSLWEATDHRNYSNSAYRKLYDRSLNLKKCYEKPELLEQPKWMGLSSLRIIRSWTVTLGEHRFTCITGADNSYIYPVRVIVPEAIEGLRRGQRFHVYGIPLAMSGYTTVLGQSAPCLVLLAGDVYISR